MKRLSTHAWIALGGAAAFAWVLLASAWMSDDAFITLRTIDNFVNGYGLRWNVAERVQSFTHPAWLFVLTPFYAITREPFYTTLVVQIAIALAGGWVLLRQVALTPAAAALAAAALVSSKAIVDFSTSGLENPLAHLCLIAVFLAWRRILSGADHALGLMAAAAVALLTRIDLLWLIAPVVIAGLIAAPRRRIVAVAAGLSPLVVWELFSLIYYGRLVPNTALAKLNTGIPSSELIWQGLKYWAATFLMDPVTPVLIVLGTIALLAFYGRPGRWMALGLMLHAIYLVRIGGDFMSGRFLTPPLIWIIAGLVGLPAVARWRASWLLTVTAAILLAGAIFPPAPPLLTGPGFGASPGEFGHFEVADERQFYYPQTGLLPSLGFAGPVTVHPWIEAGRKLRVRRGDRRVVVAGNIGFFGYYAGPDLYIVDRNALADPLLAMLPARRPWRIGHFTRDVPEGYVEGLERGENGVTDARIHALNDAILVVTRGPIWNWGRAGAIAGLLNGRIGP